MTNSTKARLILAAAAASGLSASKGFGQILYDPFNYTSGATLDAGANVSTSGSTWSQRGSQTGNPTIASGSLGAATVGTVPALPPSLGNSALLPLANTGRTPAINFGQTFTAAGDYYYSFTIKAPSTLTAGSNQVIGGYTNFAIPTPNAPTVFQAGLRLTSVAGGAGVGNFTLGMSSGGTAQQFSGDTFDPGETVFVVARYRIVAGTNNDQVAMWINPNSGFGDNGAAILGTPSLSWTHASGDSVDSANPSNPMLAGFFLRSQAAASGFQIDEVRVDTSWAGVTPDGTKQYAFNNAAGGSWSTAANWNDYQNNVSGTAPNAIGHVANFTNALTSGSTITVDGGGKTVDQVVFTNSGNLTIGGTDTLTFNSNASAASVTAYAGSHTISAPVSLTSNLSVKAQSGATVTFGGAITTAGKTLGIYGNGTGTVKLSSNNQIDSAARIEARSGTLDLNSTSQSVNAVQLGTGSTNNGSAISTGVLYKGDLASGNITNGTLTSATDFDLQSGTASAALAGATAAVGVVKSNAGQVTLSGTNTYAGTTTVNCGVLTLSGTNTNPVVAQLNVPTPSSLGATSTLALTSNASLGANNATVTFASTGGLGATLQFSETMSLAADRTINANATLSRLAAIAGRTASIDALITGTGGVDITYPFDATVASGTGTGGLAVNGGVVVLRNTGNNYAGTTTVSGGRLLLPATNVAPGFGVPGKYVAQAVTAPASTTAFPATLSVGVGGAGEWSNADIDTLRTTATFGAGTYLGFDTTNATSPYTYPATMASGAYGISKHAPGTVTLTGDIGLTGNILGAGGTLELTGALSHGGTVTASGGTVVLAGNNTYAGQTIAETGGVVRVTHNNGLGSTAGNTLARGGADAAVVQIDGTAGSLSIPENFQLSGRSSTGNASINNTAGSNTLTGTLTYGTGGNHYNLASNAGTLTIAGNIVNTLTGATFRQLNLRGTAAGVITGSLTNPGTGNTDYRVVKDDAGTWTLAGVNGQTSTTVNAGTLLLANADAVGGASVEVKDGALARAQAALPKAVTVTTLATNTTGKFDVTNNSMVIKSMAPGAVRTQLQAGYASGTWNGSTGIISTSVTSETSVGYATNAQLGSLTEFKGVTGLTGTDVLLKYTYAGDANLDGKVDIGDLGLLAGAWQQLTGKVWFDGDFTYDGAVDIGDLGLLAGNWQKGTAGNPNPPLMTFSEAMAQFSAFDGVAVPEPTGLALLGLGGIGLLARRRRP